MKKLIIGAAIAAMGLGAFATGNEVSSANCVGYMTKSITAGTFYMVGVQFENVGADSVATFDKILSMNGVKPVSFEDMDDRAAVIDVRVGNVYLSYYYINDAEDADGNYVTGWADGDGYLFTDTLQLGDGFWFHAPEASANATLTVAGQVTEATSLSIEIPAGNVFKICANPFPTAVNLKNVVTTGIAEVAFEDMDNAARIDVRVGNVYLSYYYLEDAENSDGDYVVGWADGDGYLVDEQVIEAGSSFWINSPNAGTLTFSL